MILEKIKCENSKSLGRILPVFYNLQISLNMVVYICSLDTAPYYHIYDFLCFKNPPIVAY